MSAPDPYSSQITKTPEGKFLAMGLIECSSYPEARNTVKTLTFAQRYAHTFRPEKDEPVYMPEDRTSDEHLEIPE